MSDKQVVMVLGAAAVLLWITKNKVVSVAGDAAAAINPVNPDNVFYSGVNAVGGALSNDSEFSLGSWIYDMTHSNEGV